MVQKVQATEAGTDDDCVALLYVIATCVLGRR
jgi:hypothetical protein